MSKRLRFLPLLALLAACSRSDTTDVAPLTAEETSLAQYLADSRLDNGAYGWNIAPDATLDKTQAGFRSVTGITALGLLDAYKRDTESAVPTAADKLTVTKNYVYSQLTKYMADENATLSATNLMFIAGYQQEFGLSTQEWQTAADCLQKRLDDLDLTHGTEDDVTIDGWVNHTVELRTGQNIVSLAGWEVAFILRGLVAMEAPKTEIDYAAARLLLMDYDPDSAYGVLSAAHALYALELVGDTTRREELVQLIVDKMDDTGRVGDDTQLSAYALMALRAAGREEADLVDEHLRSQVDEKGYILERDGKIYFEVVSEVISALLH